MRGSTSVLRILAATSLRLQPLLVRSSLIPQSQLQILARRQASCSGFGQTTGTLLLQLSGSEKSSEDNNGHKVPRRSPAIHKKSVYFRRATVKDAPMFTKWDEQDHLQDELKYGDYQFNWDQWNWETELERDDSGSTPWRHQLIAVVQNPPHLDVPELPIGIVQVIDPSREDSCYWGDEGKNEDYIAEFCRPEIRALDIWIGEPMYLGMGLGTHMMRLALKDYCFNNPAVQTVLIDPMETHPDAIRFYQKKCGFRPYKLCQFGPDKCLVHKLERSRWEAWLWEDERDKDEYD